MGKSTNPGPESGPREWEKQAAASPKWITPLLLQHTIEVWSKQSGRAVCESEAVQILLNTRRLISFARRIALRSNDLGTSTILNVA